ncbi:MAG: 16S rRNA (cytidine(1402)-2'-O)-methyltransferase [Bacillota bacterium]|jgi:16S rRNA (cytidine1402-2'-O)-methyltransferase
MLYLCATPIGNLADVTQRVLDVLRSVDLIAAEDTRHTRKLLAHYQIHKPLVSYHEHNEHSQAEELLRQVSAGAQVAVVSDAGMPGISDPGVVLVQKAVEQGLPFTVLPGPSAVLTALVLSGLDTDQFAFLGFPPRNSSKRRQWLETFRSLPLTLVFYEAPHRLQGCLKDLLESLGDRQIAVARELTKQFEEVRRGSLSEMVRFYAEHEPRGEFVLVVAGCSDEEGEGAEPDWEAALAAVDRLLAQGEETSAAIRQVALNQRISRRELYNLFHERQRRN